MELEWMWLIADSLVKYVGYEIWVYPETSREKIQIVEITSAIYTIPKNKIPCSTSQLKYFPCM